MGTELKYIGCRHPSTGTLSQFDNWEEARAWWGSISRRATRGEQISKYCTATYWKPDKSDFWEAIGYIIVALTIAINLIGIVHAITAGMFAGLGAEIARIVKDIGSGFADTLDVLVDGVGALKDGFGQFLELIHYDTIIQVHKIAWVLSEDYRTAVRHIYYQISNASSALFDNSATLHMIFQNSRALILSSSAMLGKKYDLANVTWLKQFDDTIQKVNARAERYRNDPERLLIDMEDWMDKPNLDAAGEGQQTLFGTINGILVSVDKTASDLFQFKTDLGVWQASLPENVRKWTKPTLDPIISRIDTFQYDIYAPKMNKLDLAINAAQRNNRENRKAVDGLDLRLDVNPVYLGDWSKLDWDRRRTEQQNAQDEYTAPVQRDMDESHSVFAEKAGRMQQEARQKVKKPEPPPPAPEVMKYEPPETPGLKVGWWQKMGGDY